MTTRVRCSTCISRNILIQVNIHVHKASDFKVNAIEFNAIVFPEFACQGLELANSALYQTRIELRVDRHQYGIDLCVY